MDKGSLDLALNVARDYVYAGRGQPYRGQMQLILEYIAAQGVEIDRLKGLLDANRNVSVGVQLYDAELFREKDAEIDRLKAASERSCAELLLLRDMEHERCRVARQEADRLKAALEEAELKLSLVWQPVDEDNEELPDLRADDDRGIFVHEDGRGIEFYCEGGELEGYFRLPEGYAVCRKVQP